MTRNRTHRLDEVFPRLPRGEDGLWHCRYCGKPIPRKGHYYRAWCPGGKCVHEAYIRAHPQSAAQELHKKEHGICRACGLDTDALNTALHELEFLARGWHAWDRKPLPERQCLLWRHVLHAVLRAMRTRGWNVRGLDCGWPEWGSLWEMDHIHEHADGGDLEPENLQTLCTPCHKAKTRAYVARKAQERREPLFEKEKLYESNLSLAAVGERDCTGIQAD